jgi:hypothetical protein
MDSLNIFQEKDPRGQVLDVSQEDVDQLIMRIRAMPRVPVGIREPLARRAADHNISTAQITGLTSCILQRFFGPEIHRLYMSWYQRATSRGNLSQLGVVAAQSLYVNGVYLAGVAKPIAPCLRVGEKESKTHPTSSGE